MSQDADFAKIMTLEDFAELRTSSDLGAVVCTSGGYDPIHPGHISCMIESKKFGDTVVVVVNDDSFLERKKGKAFQDHATRCLIVAGVRGVDYVIKFQAPPGDDSVTEALRAIKPAVFTKGGDRKPGNLPTTEEALCAELGVRIVDGVGMIKDWSSSDFLADWGRFWAENSATRE